MAAIELNLRPDQRVLRQFGFVSLAGFGLLAVAAWTESLIFSFGLGDHRQTVTILFLSIAAVSTLFSLVAPRANLGLYWLLTVATYPIGFVLSYVIMAILFFAVFAPIGATMRLLGRDSLQRRARVGATTYWQDSGPPRPMRTYFRQS